MQEKIGPSDALIRAMVEQYAPQVSNADLAGWILFAVHSRRTQNICAVIDGICGTVEDFRTLGVAATTNCRRFLLGGSGNRLRWRLFARLVLTAKGRRFARGGEVFRRQDRVRAARVRAPVDCSAKGLA